MLSYTIQFSKKKPTISTSKASVKLILTDKVNTAFISSMPQLTFYWNTGASQLFGYFRFECLVHLMKFFVLYSKYL